MNYIYDLILNFTDCDNLLEFYEWMRKDSFITVQKIPIFRIDRFQMDDILNNRIKISEEIFDKIKNRTFVSEGENLKYSFLVTDLNRVIALDFNRDRVLKRSSSLLLDEEEDVIDECSTYTLDSFEYEIIENYRKGLFLTRKEKVVREKLLTELKYLYDNKIYDEINYLYQELYDEKRSIKEKYLFLVDEITNHYDSKYNKLYDIIKLT